MDIVNILIGDLEPLSFMVGVLFSAPFWFVWGVYHQRSRTAKQNIKAFLEENTTKERKD